VDKNFSVSDELYAMGYSEQQVQEGMKVAYKEAAEGRDPNFHSGRRLVAAAVKHLESSK